MSLAEPTPDRDGADLWWVEPANPATDHDAAARGLVLARRILQLRRSLPLPTELGDPAPTRAFRPGLDDSAWLETNAAAFRDHPDQGRWTADDLATNIGQPWFDAEGFRLHEIGGRLAGFCWTKLHPATPTDPQLGEIYVIGVHPDFWGRGLGRALTAAGLGWMWEHHHPSTGMLYVESTNTAARGLYESMGFEAHHERVSYRRAAP